MKYQLAIFDLDGTILNTLKDLYLAMNYALREKNFPERSLLEIKSFVGNGILKLIKRSVPVGTSDEEIMQIHQIFREYYSEHCKDNTAPYSDIIEVIQKLRNAGIKTAVISNKIDSAVKILCQDYFPNLFDIVTGEKQGVPRKPAPDSVQAILQTLHYTSEQAIYIGDSEVDIQTAKNSGLSCISVAWGFRDEEFLKANGAGQIIFEPSALLNLLLS
ncbi:MAG: HAD family hydrolase [Oscillospiraceae bacterium]|nr:HAD family hydrolase [Oscillospiraceae bacterium]